MLPYSIDVVCLDQTGIVAGLSGFFASRGIDIVRGLDPQLSGRPHRRADVRGADDHQRAWPSMHVAQLREEFMEFCDSLNLDAILEPVKS